MNRNKIFVIVGLITAIIVTSVIVLLISNKKTITYNVYFNTNGGSVIETQIVNKGEQLTKPTDPIKEGYMFVEWTYQGKTYDFSQEVHSDLTLIAKWIELNEDVETYIIKFDADGGTSISNQIVKKGDKVKKPTDPVKEGYIFNGWTLNNEIYDFEKVVEKSLELKAKWEKIKENENNTTNNSSNNNNSSSSNNNNNTTKPSTPTAKKYTVTFNSNGGSSVSSQTVVEGNKATQPSNPTRNGYNFAGWLLNGNPYNFNSTVTGNITLVAKWNQKSYTVVATKVDAYSPDSVLSVYEEGTKITVQAIKYSDGTYLCSGTNPTVNTGDIAGETSFIVVLNDGTQVNATLS